MTIMEMLKQSGMLALMGVSITFSFLLILVISITLMGKIIQVLVPNNNIKNTTANKLPDKEITANQGEIIAAITAAVSQYRKTNER